MAQVKLKEKESKVVKTATFEPKDFIAIKLKSGKVCLVHKIQGENLIKAKKATEVKDAEIEKVRSHISKVVIDKKK